MNQLMIWPGTSDPYKRKKIIKFLIISAGIGALAVVFTTIVVNPLIGQQPHNSCINNVETNWKISFTFELIVDGQKLENKPDIGFVDEGCQRAIYTLSEDGTVYAEWKENPNFEIGHFLYIAQFPLRDMDQKKSTIYVNDKESPHFIKHPIQDGYHYKAVFTSKAYDEAKDRDFLPEDIQD